MLWNILKKDEYQTDVVEVLREKNKEVESILKGLTRDDIDEVFLFFDYDAHQNNLKDDLNISPTEVLEEMLEIFNDETELGKLYINYPMIEAVRDFSNITCIPFAGKCLWNVENFSHYKEATGANNMKARLERYNINDWKEMCVCFAMRIGCLFDIGKIPEYSFFYDNINSETILKKQKEKYIKDGRIFVLSAIPQFLLEYHQEKFWRGYIGRRKNLKPIKGCIKTNSKKSKH